MSRVPATIVLAVALLVVSTARVSATYSPVNPAISPPNGWPTKRVLDYVYFGGVDTFSPATHGGSVYTGGGITATRVDDFGRGGVLDATTGAPGVTDDQLWTGQSLRVTPKFREAAHMSFFDCWVDGQPAPPLLSGITGYLTPTSHPDSAIVTVPPGSTFVWVFGVYGVGTGNYQLWYSEQGLNSDGMDHLLSYQITGLGMDQPTWLLFWEDQYPFNSNPYPSDGDYNDLVIEVTAIPEPATLVLLALGALAVTRRRRGR
jgi:hypothetical protein